MRGFLISLVSSAFGFLIFAAIMAGDAPPRSSVDRCFSSLNGSHADLVDAVRSSLNDPSSFRHVRTVLGGQEGSDRRAVVMTYRATNLLGGTVEARASAMIFPPSCRIDIVSLEH